MKRITPISRLILSAGCLALAVSSYAFFYGPSADKHTAIVEAIEQFEALQRDNVKLVQAETRLRREYRAQRAQYDKIQKALHQTYRREEMLHRLGNHLKQAGITLKRYTPLSNVQVGTTQSPNGCLLYCHNQITFDATFHQLMAFLARCKDMPLVMSIDHIQLDRKQDSRDNALKVILKYSIFAGHAPAGEASHDA